MSAERELDRLIQTIRSLDREPAKANSGNERVFESIIKDYEELYLNLELELAKMERRLADVDHEFSKLIQFKISVQEKNRNAKVKVSELDELSDLIFSMMERLQNESNRPQPGNRLIFDQWIQAHRALKNILEEN